MKQRIIVAVIGIPLLLAILCVAPDWATAALLAALSVVGTHELLAAVCGPEKTRRWTALPAVMGILVVLHFYGAGHGWQLPLGIVDGLLLVGVIALPAAGVLSYGKPHALTLLDVCVMDWCWCRWWRPSAVTRRPCSPAWPAASTSCRRW